MNERPIDTALRLAREKGWNQAQFAAEVGASSADVSNWKKRGMPPERHVAVADALGTSVDTLLSRSSSNVEEAPALKGLRRLPVVGEVKGGEDGFLEELEYPVGHGDGYIEYPTSDTNAYALRVRGDSMHPRFRAGEFVVVEPSIQPQDGDDVIVLCTDGRKILKQLNWMRDGEVQLLSVNNGYAPLTLDLSEVVSIQLVAGRVRKSAFQRNR
jgi:phage repressor protein C with HTH and peptisase S24 domain